MTEQAKSQTELISQDADTINVHNVHHRTAAHPVLPEDELVVHVLRYLAMNRGDSLTGCEVRSDRTNRNSTGGKFGRDTHKAVLSSGLKNQSCSYTLLSLSIHLYLIINCCASEKSECLSQNPTTQCYVSGCLFVKASKSHLRSFNHRIFGICAWKIINPPHTQKMKQSMFKKTCNWSCFSLSLHY